MSEPRAWTEEEARNKFLDYVWTMIRYWEKEDRTPDVSGKLEGLAFSILSAIDGESSVLRGFRLTVSPHPDDEQYHRGNGDNWYTDGLELQWLHEHFHQRKKK